MRITKNFLYLPLAFLTFLTTAGGFARDTYHYTVRGETVSQLWLSPLQQITDTPNTAVAAPDVHLMQRYHYHLVVQSVGGNLFEASWDQWRVETELTPELKQLLEQIQKLSPTYFRRAPDGAIEFFAPEGAEAWQRQAVASILYPFQFVRPNPKSTEWRAEEFHPSGKIIARYRLVRTEKDGVQVINKAVAQVLLTPEEQEIGKTHQILGSLQYRIDSQGVILSISGTLRERTGLNGLPVSRNDLKLSIRLDRRTSISEQAARAKRAKLSQHKGRWYSLFAPPTPAEQEIARARSQLGDTTQEQLLQSLDTMLAQIEQGETVPADKQTVLRLKLDAGLVIYGTSFVSELQKRLLARARDDDGFWLLIGVLSQSERPEAQRVLVEAFDRLTNFNQQLGLAQQFAFLKTPRPETVQLLWERAKAMPEGDLKQVLLMSVSNLARRLPTSEVYRAITEWSRAQLQAASTQEQVQYWIAVIGALGDVESLPLLERYARQGEEMTRLRAAEALASLPAKTVLPVFASIYPSEPSATVRERIVTACARWWNEPQARQLLERAAFNDPALSVRKACIKALGELAQRDSDALNLLVKIAETNSEASIRREAMITLAALRAAGVQVPPVKASP